jgi:hypothetical protein
MRLKQQIPPGIGGYRSLEALGIETTVCHMNEGHSAFLGLEWVRKLACRSSKLTACNAGIVGCTVTQSGCCRSIAMRRRASRQVR